MGQAFYSRQGGVLPLFHNMLGNLTLLKIIKLASKHVECGAMELHELLHPRLWTVGASTVGQTCCHSGIQRKYVERHTWLEYYGFLPTHVKLVLFLKHFDDTNNTNGHVATFFSTFHIHQSVNVIISISPQEKALLPTVYTKGGNNILVIELLHKLDTNNLDPFPRS